MPWCAWSPHHITSIFYPVYTSSPLSTGSLGIGLAVEPGYTSCFPGVEEPLTETARRALRLIGARDLRGKFISPLPPGRGYAVSAASAITSVLASVKIGGRKVGVLEALQAAHKAEVLERTGLGDVLALSCGIGIVIRLHPGAPGLGRVECVPLPRSIGIISVEGEGRSTRELLSEGYIRESAPLALRLIRRVSDEMSLESFVYASRIYTDRLNLLRHVVGGQVDIVRSTPGLIGYYAKKSVAVVIVEEDRLGDAFEHLGNLKGVSLRLLRPSESGVRVWWDYGT
ncbi:MAG: hypothetical protein F7C35_02195 [Desulfurococcales archaeon]|nr:hypothetical protein [Desulfurococcales archaeon]